MNGRRGAPDGANALSIAGPGSSLRPASSSRAALKFTDTFTSRNIDTKEKP